jgi:hypothetical protein
MRGFALGYGVGFEEKGKKRIIRRVQERSFFLVWFNPFPKIYKCHFIGSVDK